MFSVFVLTVPQKSKDISVEVMVSIISPGRAYDGGVFQSSMDAPVFQVIKHSNQQ
jgi:hypothetical protein